MESTLGVLWGRSRLADSSQADSVEAVADTIHAWGASWLLYLLLLEVE